MQTERPEFYSKGTDCTGLVDKSKRDLVIDANVIGSFEIVKDVFVNSARTSSRQKNSREEIPVVQNSNDEDNEEDGAGEVQVQ